MRVTSSATLSNLLEQLQRLTAGLLYQSESDAPLQILSCLKPADSLPNKALLSLLEEPIAAPVQVVSLAYFLRHHTAAHLGNAAGQAMAERYEKLQSFMEEHLSEVKVYRVGSEPRIHAYALGEAEDNQLAGFKTVLIET